ncbi:hypothetical protein NP493_675g00025 [Ridgeia piscesae]|uniref:Cyclic nucleotide-binding domain-containing protein n=1 Tax=Ridgeia piscesae TaxID=27915 RepID=A0AAD9KRA2_RIDPI|nr:hypothetical protein NP493_675g00025 [Ridgeia piscesae]
MELEIARHVAYERYDDGRVIAWQGRLPNRVYYVIGGRIAKLRTYSLWTGRITKTMAYLTKGMTTDLQELEQQWVREDSLVAMGDVEVLFLDKEACDELSHKKCGPPFEFLRTLDLFKGFPDRVFSSHAEAFEVSYFAQNKVVVKDSNRTPWLHVIKSGHVKVIRRQTVFDVATLNQNIFRCSRVEQIGCGRQFSHASAMLGVQAKQKKLKAARTAVLPSINQTNGPTGKAYARPTGIGVSPEPRRCSVRASATGGDEDSDDTDGTSTTDAEYTILPAVSFIQPSTHSTQDDTPATPPDDVTDETKSDSQSQEDLDESSESDEDSLQNDETSTNKQIRLRHHRKTWLNIPLLTEAEDEDLKRSALWLTRGATELSIPRPKKDPQCRAAYLELDTLNPGDVFGLDRMQRAPTSDPQGLLQLSDGAEIVRVNKRFFLQYACNNAMLKIETNQKEYISEEEAKRALYDKETWEQYKTAVWQRISAMHNPPPMSSR